MRRTRHAVPALGAGLLTAAGILATGATGSPALGATAPAAAAVSGPTIKLIPAQKVITAGRFGTQVFLDPGIWVASLGSALRINVQRASYTQPVTATQVLGTGRARRERRLPNWTVAGWNGLRDFARLTVRNHAGQVVASAKLPFCPIPTTRSALAPAAR